MRGEQRSKVAQEYHRLYNTPAWRALRDAHRRLEPLCRMCKPRLVPMKIVDHVTPHRGDITRFFDHANLQSLCEYHANKWKQAAEASKRKAVGLDGWPIESSRGRKV